MSGRRVRITDRAGVSPREISGKLQVYVARLASRSHWHSKKAPRDDRDGKIMDAGPRKCSTWKEVGTGLARRILKDAGLDE
jgi:hypothetical protein